MSRERILDLTSRLVSIDTCSAPMNPEGMLAALDEVSNWLGEEGITFSNKGVHSRLWGGGGDAFKPRLLLCGHMDVVRASKYELTLNPDGDRIMGRGTGDMKGNDAAMVEAFGRLKDEESANGIGLLLTGDEEIGGFDGARKIVDEGGLRPSLVFIPDGEFNFDICTSQKAPHHMKFKASSTGGHAARAFRLINPDRLVSETIREIQDRLSKASLERPWESTFEVTFRHTMVAEPLGKTGVENSVNSIPAYADAGVSWRFPMELYDFADTRRWIGEIAGKHGVVVEDLHGGGEGCLTDVNNRDVQLWKRTIEDLLKRQVGITVAHGASDGRHFYRYKEITVLATSAIAGEAHNDLEWASLGSLDQLSEAIYRFAKKLV